MEWRRRKKVKNFVMDLLPLLLLLLGFGVGKLWPLLLPWLSFFFCYFCCLHWSGFGAASVEKNWVLLCSWVCLFCCLSFAFFLLFIASFCS